MKSYCFPRNFIWGVAAAAPQIEGAAREDGKGESIWDRFARLPGKVANGDTPDIACDHYHRYREDFALMRRLGVKNYRLSLAWPRLHPDGGRDINQKGIDFYRRLFDSMERNGITPWVTFYHWDLPQALEDAGGWRVRATAEAFARYCATAARAFRDHVRNWITLNEIPTFIGNGYRVGMHAPGAREPGRVLNQAFHHTLLAHGYAVSAVREHGGRGSRVGLTQDLSVSVPVTETPRDIVAARAELALRNEHLLAPVFHGRYPAGYLRRCGKDRPEVKAGDMKLISQPTDFLGLNIYSGHFVRAKAGRGREVLAFPPRYPEASFEWLKIVPQSIYWAIRHCHELYHPRAFYITENGASFPDPPAADGEIVDLHRRDFVRNYLVNVHRAVGEGLPCRGYFLWSFLDNYEWAAGYGERFGIVHVDYATQKRTPKLSARWYAEVMRRNQIV
ncbi:GH1 family beta-glucosidase [Termitidicoccus mucosus]|uniref:Beta-glucosidase n=1 Tax=Termitidicoccus mucosus TaxID=1184151 RepID=A0A178IN52_9BACT|nr:beta-glucosidase [Opitutaceae bacterium TSB47]